MSLSKIFMLYLWIAPHLLLTVVSVLMIRKKIYKDFPIFLVYTVYEFIQCIVLVTLDQKKSISDQQYFYVDLVGTAISIALRFGIIHEIFQNVFRNYSALTGLGRLLMRWATAVLALVAVVAAAYASSNGVDHLISTMYVTRLAINIVQCGLLLLLFMFSRYFGISWRNYVFGIALGLGVYAAVDLVNSTVQSQFNATLGSGALTFLNILLMGTYHVCVLVWIAYMLAPEPVMIKLKTVPANDLEGWNHELERLLQQ